MGLITKQGVLILNYAEHLQEDQGKSKFDAIIEASRVRLRPILMTTFAMLFGAIPLCVATGAGHTSLNEIGVVIVGGLSFGCLMTLFLLPVVYMLISPAKKKKPNTAL